MIMQDGFQKKKIKQLYNWFGDWEQVQWMEHTLITTKFIPRIVGETRYVGIAAELLVLYYPTKLVSIHSSHIY